MGESCWLPSLDTLRTCAIQLAVCSNRWTDFVFIIIDAEGRAVSMTGTQSGYVSNSYSFHERLPLGRLSSNDSSGDHLEEFLRVVGATLAAVLQGFALVLGRVGRSIEEQWRTVALLP
jgi:hypothetical protein